MGLKPSDYRTVALCAECHGKQHAHGERTFWGDRNPDMPILQNLVDWLDKQGKTKEAIAALEAVAEGL